MTNQNKLLIAVGVVVLIAGGFFLYMTRSGTPTVVPEPPVTVQPTPAPIEHPVAVPPGEPPLPNLTESDSATLARLAQFFDLKRYGEMLVLESVINRFVVVVDNLDRRNVPQRVMLTQPIKGSFVVAKTGGDKHLLDERNFQRYEPFIAMVETMDIDAFVALYKSYYPLFQQAYEEIGYPNKYFNDRLVKIIEHLLATPPLPSGPILLAQPKVLYQFADPALERLSFGQKTILRMGRANAARINARLQQLHATLVTQDIVTTTK